MGMLFNTPATIYLLNSLNSSFNKANLPGMKNNVNYFSHGKPANGTFKDIAKPLGLLDDGNHDTNHANWKVWLDSFDKADDSKHQGKKVLDTVFDGIVNGLTDTKEDDTNQAFSQIEFFAVPESSNTLGAEVMDVQDMNGDWSKTITVFTNTYDKYKALGRKKKSPGGKGKKK